MTYGATLRSAPVFERLVVAPVVGPATVLGLLGGVLDLVHPGPSALAGRVAGLCASWVILVAVRLARLPTAALDWSPGPLPLLLPQLIQAEIDHYPRHPGDKT